MFELTDKRILITGASRGLGAVCAREFARIGARLVLTARSAGQLAEVRTGLHRPERHLAVPADLSDYAQIPPLLDQARECLGGIDVVLHVAGGGLGLREPLLPAPDMETLLRVNLLNAVEINRLVAEEMIQRGGGNLVHVLSITASEGVGSVGYNTAKAALAAYVRSFGNAMAAHQVVVTGILPGGFWAPGNSWERLQAQKPEVVEKFIADRLPRGRLGQAEEVVPLLRFLCSDAASMMGGCLVPIDAGEGRTYVLC